MVISIEEFLDRKKGVIGSAQEFADLMEFEQEHGWANDRYETASVEVWFEILDTRPDLTHAVTLYKRLPDAVLTRLARHKCKRVRSFILWKGKLPAEALEILSYDEDLDIVYCVALHSLTPGNVLQRLSKDERHASDSKERSIADAAQANLVMRAENISANALRELARHSNVEVRRRLAGRKDIPADILELLAADEDGDVVRRIIINKKTPASVLETIVAGGRGGQGAKTILERRRTRDANRARNGRPVK